MHHSPGQAKRNPGYRQPASMCPERALQNRAAGHFWSGPSGHNAFRDSDPGLRFACPGL